MENKRTLVVIATLVVAFFCAEVAQAGLAVTSLNNKRVYSFDNAGNGTLRAGPADFFTPTGITYGSAGPNGRLIVADTLLLNGQLKQISPSNVVSPFVGPIAATVTPVGMATDAFGNIYSANYLTKEIYKYDPLGNGTLFADAADGLVGPIGLDVDAAGNVFVADVDGKQIIKFDQFGTPTLFADASDGLFTPVDVAVDSNGNVFVADTFWNAGTIWKFNPSGSSVSVFADTSDGILTPTGLAVEQGSNFVYVANYLIDTIVALSPTGNASLFADASDGIDGPWQIATPYVVPEPSSIAIWSLLGLVGFGWRRWKNRAAA